MKKTRKIVVTLALVMVLAMPVLGLSLAAPKATNTAHALRFGEGVTIDFLAPLKNRTDFYGGAVLPVKVLVIDNDDAPAKGANVTIWVNNLPATSVGALNTGNQMKNLQGGLYMYNLNTKPYPAGPGSPPITIKVIAFVPEDHPAEASVIITLD